MESTNGKAGTDTVLEDSDGVSPRFPRRQGVVARALVTVFGPMTWRNVRGWLAIIAIVLILRWAWFDQFKIPSGSMEPTLHGDPALTKGDRVSINKFIYGHRFPLNDLRIPFVNKAFHYADRRIWRGAEPKRWEIVVFKTVEEDMPGKTLIKRVVGLPGERVHIAKGKVRINGKVVEPPDELRDVLRYTTGPDDRDVRRFILRLAGLSGPPSTLNPAHEGARRLIETLADLHTELNGKDSEEITDEAAEDLLRDMDLVAFRVARELLNLKHAEMGTFRYGVLTEDEYSVVPEDCYFLLGDNSRESKDGRAFGWVPNEHIMGRAFCLYWPVTRWRDFTGFSCTWWGRMILYGIPGLIVVTEVARFSRRRRARNAAAGDGPPTTQRED